MIINLKEVKKVKIINIYKIGLRNLSAKVRDIVLELRSTSYKDVAEKLI